MKKTSIADKILYIHGLNSSAESHTAQVLREHLPECEIYCETFDLLRPERVIPRIETLLGSGEFKCVIASSLGAFYALNSRIDIPMILINPCMKPSQEIHKLERIEDVLIQKSRQIEDQLYANLDDYKRRMTFGIFGDQDELFSYRPLFEELFGTENRIIVSGQHVLREDILMTAVRYGINCLNRKA